MLDRIHPSGRGHALLAGLVAGFLRSEQSALRASTSSRTLGASFNASSTVELTRPLPHPLFFSRGSSFELDREALVCVRGRAPGFGSSAPRSQEY